jgi:hypothetical protein
LYGHARQLIPVAAGIGDLMGDDGMMRGIDSGVDVIANDAGATCLLGTRIWISNDICPSGGILMPRIAFLEVPHLLLQDRDLVLQTSRR